MPQRGYQCDFEECPRRMHGKECSMPHYKLCKDYPATPEARMAYLYVGFMDIDIEQQPITDELAR